MYIRKVKFFVITKDQNQRVYADPDGKPFAASPENTTAAENNYNYIVNGNGNTVNNQFIDNENGVVTNIKDDSTTQQFDIDYITYNFDDHSYTVNTYNYDNRTYTYYTWQYTYNITNTYYTYIGTSAEYQNEAYEFYYELPDGRSSADLTAEEIAGMSFQFTDVVNYERSATDTSLRSLYHFDGNTDDASYFSTQTEFAWNTGASITYMDSGVFDGCLYLDNTAHSFDLTLPSHIASADFTLQFRYYQASEPDTQNNIENTLSIGATAVLKWDEASLYNGSGAKLCALPVGSWNEVAIMRHNGTVYTYLNGIKVGQVSNTTAFNNKLSFVLGSTSRAYSQIDELRFVNFAVAESGKSYTCTAVPYDTNSVLVLPGGAHPIADEYIEWDTTYENLLSWGSCFSEGDSTPIYFAPSSYSNSSGYDGSKKPVYVAGNGGGLDYSLNPDCLSLSASASRGYSSISSTFPYDLSWDRPRYSGVAVSLSASAGANGFRSETSYSKVSVPITDTSTYTFTVMDTDFNRYSITFRLTAQNRISQAVDCKQVVGTYSKEYDWGFLLLSDSTDTVSNWRSCVASILLKPNQSLDIAYMELVKGSTPNTGHKKVTCIYSDLELKPNTAAVQSDIPVSGYTVGGVRPTFPKRGDVWFPVSGSRITGCYIYTGSMWQEAGCRYYTGKRWIPIYALDIYTMADCWDTADGGDVQQSITSEYNFWNWWQKSWLDFRQWLSANWTGSPGGSGSGGGSINEDDFPVDTPAPGEEDNGFTILDLLVALKDGSWRIIKGVVSIGADGLAGLVGSVGDIGNFFDAYGQGGIFDIENFGGDDIWD
ncbi:MAG: LamG domain-containing protein [Oscillospiraceae bacterium]|nr:LamG domain-containing protein [Oscillospiraceae bacterium]